MYPTLQQDSNEIRHISQNQSTIEVNRQIIHPRRNRNFQMPRTGPQDLIVTHYDCEENKQKTLHKYAINQVTQCKTEPQAI